MRGTTELPRRFAFVSSVAQFILCLSAKSAKYQSALFPELGAGVASKTRKSAGINSGELALMKSAEISHASLYRGIVCG
jgi:hypothetical protein